MAPKEETSRGYSLYSPKKTEPDLEFSERLKLFFGVHWRGVAVVTAPIFLTLVFWLSLPIAKSQWVGYTLILMACYWVTECIPLAITAFLPLALFPLVGIMETRECASKYMNDTVMMFLGSLILAYSVEQSCLHKRLAYFSIQTLGYSHLRLLLAMCCVTCFASMWITNTAATTMMVPINFALLKVFEDQGVLHMYDKTVDGDLTASDVTSCYFCAVTFSATVGGIGTLVGTGTNLVFKGFMAGYSDKEYLSFPMFSAFAVPYMIVLEIFVYMYFAVLYFGFLRPASETAKKAIIPVAVQEAAKSVIDADVKKKGSLSYWEGVSTFNVATVTSPETSCSAASMNYTAAIRKKEMVVILFGGAMLLFFSRSPQMFPGWGDLMTKYFDRGPRFIRDSALAMIVAFLMFLLPRDKVFFQNFTVKYKEDLPKTRSLSVLSWTILNSSCPYAFSFLLGGGFSLSAAASTSGLNAKLGSVMKSSLEGLPKELIILIIIIVVVFITNFASNVAVCTVFTPICMQLAENIKVHPLWYCIASGYAASFCFMIPVGTPGNLIVQSAAKVSTSKMMACGSGPTVSTILISWICMLVWAPIIWSDIRDFSTYLAVKKEKI